MLTAFLDKAIAALFQGIHLTIIDIYPPTARDSQGIHGALWSLLGDESYVAPEDKPLTLASYAAANVIRAYVEPVAVGDTLPDMPLFLDPSFYVNVPLEGTYQLSYRGVPHRWRDVLEKV